MLEPSKLKVPEHFLEMIAKSAKGDGRIIEAFRTVPREFFMDEAMRRASYVDSAQPIGYKQTISQPSLVAMMLKELDTAEHHNCLEIGAGSGFVTALLAKLVDEVWALEYLPPLAETARTRMRKLKLLNTHIITGDGSKGYAEKAPYDRILVSAGAAKTPDTLVAQLKIGGIMLIPVNGRLLKINKGENGLTEKDLAGVSFVDFVNS